MYHPRLIDKYLLEWAKRPSRKPVLLRGARQVGKSTAVRNLGTFFNTYIEINFEKQPEYKALFKENLDVKRIVSQISALYGKTIEVGKALLFFDEIQSCQEAIMSLRFFKEDMPDLHVIAAGSLLEFALEQLPTFGVGRIHSMFMSPMTFDEFAIANGEKPLLDARNQATPDTPLPEPLHNRLVSLLRTYMLVGGMPEVVSKWVERHDYIECQEIQDNIIVSYEDDFPKYRNRANPALLRHVLHSAAVQSTKKFSYSAVGGYRADETKKALDMLILAGILIPVTRTDANGLPLGSEADKSYRKLLVFDSGLMLRMLNMSSGDISGLTSEILTSDATNLVNKGPMAELIAGLEILRYNSPNIRHDLYYWIRMSKNSQAEIDYVVTMSQKVLPVEIKAGTQGGMKSLWIFMRDKHLTHAVRCSLENFGKLTYTDKDDSDAIRDVDIYPLYAISCMAQRRGVWTLNNALLCLSWNAQHVEIK